MIGIKTAATAVAVGALGAAALIGAPSAQADNASYLQALKQGGLVVYNPALALTWGNTICTALGTHRGDNVAVWFYSVTSNDIPDINTAAFVVMTAVEQLCPWHDHRNQVA